MNIPFAPLVELGAVAFALINFFKYISAKDWNAALTQAVVWVVGVVVAFVFSATSYAAGVSVGGIPFSKLGWADIVFIGVVLVSLLTAYNEGLKALDVNNSSVTPMLFPQLSRVKLVSRDAPHASEVDSEGHPLDSPQKKLAYAAALTAEAHAELITHNQA